LLDSQVYLTIKPAVIGTPKLTISDVTPLNKVRTDELVMIIWR